MPPRKSYSGRIVSRAVAFSPFLFTFALAAPAHAQRQRFDDWLAGFLNEARTRGFSDALLQDTLVGLTPLPRVIASDRRQAEATLTFDEYVRRRVTPEMIQRGR